MLLLATGIRETIVMSALCVFCARGNVYEIETGISKGLSVSRAGAFAVISCHEMKRRCGCARTPSSIDAMQSQPTIFHVRQRTWGHSHGDACV